MIRLRTGNLSTSTLKAVWHERSRPDPNVDRARLVEWARAGFDEVEDYVAWGVVEQRPGRWDFTLHHENLDAIEAAGMEPWIYPWLHVSPHWWTRGELADDDALFVPSRCAATGRAGYFPSLFAESTWTRLARFYAAVNDALGSRVEGIAIAWPTDYGEVGAASNISRWLFPHRPAGPAHGDAFWYGDEPARRALADWIEIEHGSLGAAAERWGVDVATLTPATGNTPPPFPVPALASSEALRIDIASFARHATHTALERMFALARDVFGSAPLEIKLGHASESVLLGRSMSDVVAIAARHDVSVRSTHSGQAPLFTKHIAASCRRHGARFTTEGPRDVARDVLARRLHDDICHGSTHLYEFPEQLAMVDIDAVRDALGTPVRGHTVAAFMPHLDLALTPGLGVPECLVVGLETLRRVVDFDFIDDATTLDGSTSALLLFDARAFASSTYNALAAWVHAGGTLIAGTPGAPRVCRAADDSPLTPQGEALHDALTRDDPARRSTPDGIASIAPADVRPIPDGVVRTHARPGEELDRFLVGEGWHGRDDGAFGWPDEEGPVPTRWTTGCARLRLPKVVGPCESRGLLVLDATIRGQAPLTPVVVWWNGTAIGRIDYPREAPGPVALPADPPRAGQPNLVTLTMPTTRPPERNGARDERELGILVREVRWVGLETPADDVGGLASIPGFTVRERATERPTEAPADTTRAFGKGTVIVGDTTPAGALDGLRTWLAEHTNTPTPANTILVRDLDETCLVTALRDGLIVFNPSRVPTTPRLVIHPHHVADIPQGTLPTIETIPGHTTRFVPWAS